MIRFPLLTASIALVGVVGLAACGGSSDGSGDLVAKADLVIESPGGLKFDKLEYTAAAKAGGIVIAQVNKDSQTHSLLVKEGSKSGPRVGPRLQDSPGSSSAASFDLKAGTYYVYCDIPGHEASMNAKLTVSG